MTNRGTTTTRAAGPEQSLPVYRAEAFVVSSGANLGDPVAYAEDLMLDDVYQLAYRARPERLALLPVAEKEFRIGHGTEAGTPGATVYLDSALTLMSPDGKTTDALVLVELDRHGMVDGVFLLPLAPLWEKTPYVLVGIDTDTAVQRLAQLACVSFTRGTRITLASGEQRPIEDLRVGDRVLTRDEGPQEIRWIGTTTVRASGSFAPICIRAGALNNDADLVVSPDHRLFIYQRSDRLGAGRSQLLVKARHLVNGHSVTVQDGGFVDYFQLLFDRHQIIYAEGIAAESMLVDQRNQTVVPEELIRRMREHAGSALSGLDVSDDLLRRPDVAELLRRASSN